MAGDEQHPAGSGPPAPAAGRTAAELVRAAEAGEAQACADAAELAMAGRLPHGGRVLVALGTAAAAGVARAQFLLGLAHMRGLHGAAQNPALAARWCAAAANQGMGEAQFNLALLHSEGVGVEADPTAAERWLRIAAGSGSEEAERCLDLIYSEPAARPATWDDAHTRTSVALASSDPEARKRMRFAEYYVDPCVNLLIRRHGLSREQSEEIVQEFMLELEEPLAKGEHRGRRWKDSLRARFRDERVVEGKRFRPYLGRVVSNFARDWLRRQRPAPGIAGGPPAESIDPEQLVDHHAEAWGALLARFHVQAAASHPRAGRAYDSFRCLVVERCPQQEATARLGLSERTLRMHLRQTGELLLIWLRGRLERGGLLDPALAAGLELLPGWLHYPTGAKRARALLFLALVEHRLGAEPAAGT
jgi:DNA-directed RNA polymerase specialized sigma24 family protein